MFLGCYAVSTGKCLPTFRGERSASINKILILSVMATFFVLLDPEDSQYYLPERR
jgi:hypothetical protein